jgi:hypothetical protein
MLCLYRIELRDDGLVCVAHGQVMLYVCVWVYMYELVVI